MSMGSYWSCWKLGHAVERTSLTPNVIRETQSRKCLVQMCLSDIHSVSTFLEKFWLYRVFWTPCQWKRRHFFQRLRPLHSQCVGMSNRVCTTYTKAGQFSDKTDVTRHLSTHFFQYLLDQWQDSWHRHREIALSCN